MLIPIERRAREPVSAQIVAYLRRAVEAGRLAPGAKLEPIRVLAKELGLNRETVATAYRELEHLGLTESTVGRGTFVRDRAPTPNGVASGASPSESPFGPGGMDLDRLDTPLGRGGARLVYTMPSFQNPAGVWTSLAPRRRLLEIVGKHGVPVLEDDFEKDLRVRGRGAPPLRALDRRGLV